MKTFYNVKVMLPFNFRFGLDYKMFNGGTKHSDGRQTLHLPYIVVFQVS